MIAGWLASKVWGIVIFLIACLSIILLPAVIVQSVRLNGFDLFGWTISEGWEWSEGYRPQALRLARENVKLVANNLVLSNGLDKCNIGVTSLEKARTAFQVEAQRFVDLSLRLQKEYADRIHAVNTIKPTDQKCVSVDKIFSAGFGK